MIAIRIARIPLLSRLVAGPLSRHGLARLSLAFLMLLAASPLAADITGTVFRDYDADGVNDAGEPGMAGVEVRAFDGSGSQVGTTQTTAADGTYTLTGITGDVRIEMLVPISITYLEPGAVGADAASSVRFASDGDTVDFGVNNPADYCESDPRFAVSCFTNGDPDDATNMGEPAIVSHLYSASGASPHISKVNEVMQEDLGPVWGLAYDRDQDILYGAAVLKRHVGFEATGGIGAIYQMNLTTNTTSVFHDFGTAAGSALVLSDADRFSLPVGSGSTPSRFGDNIDGASFALAGMVGFGDIDLSEDGSVLYVVNLFDQQVYTLSTTGAPSPTVIAGAPWIATSPGGGTARPWGLAVQDGVLYVGVVSDDSPLAFQVYLWDGTSWSTAFASPVPLTYTRQVSDAHDPPGVWVPWVNTYTGSTVDLLVAALSNDYAVPQAILADLEIEPDGDLVLGFMDRGGLQYGYETPEPDDTNAGDVDILYWPAGDLLRASRSGSNWVIEDGSSGSGATCCGPGGLEFYNDLPDWVLGDQTNFFAHDINAGGLMLNKGTGEAASTSSDQVRPFSGSMAWFDLSDGSRDRSLEIFFDSTSTDFSKAGGLGDLELMCSPAPLELGNRVWCDANNNGVQDPGTAEGGIAGVDVVLECPRDATVTVTTDVNGNYLFTDSAYSAVNGTPIPRAETCTISIDTSGSNGTAITGGCGTITPATADAGGVDAGADLRDSDGTDLGSGIISTTVTTGTAGSNDHSTDFGFLSMPPLTYDYGDAPDSYGTTAGARHEIPMAGATLYMGACVDGEAAGQPATAGDPADGDDLNDLGAPITTSGTCVGNDDEDGVSFTSMIAACSMADVTVSLQGAGLLDAWIDFDGDGDFGDAGEQIFASQAVAAGANALSFSVPCSAASGTTYARFRVSTAGGLGAADSAVDGEVEDYRVTTKGIDLGDAPDTYQTTMGASGASHVIDPASPIYLGACVDGEADGQPGAGATGDDVGVGAAGLGTCVGNDDEDGVTFDTMVAACGQATVTVVGQGSGGVLDAWIDFDGDGDFGDAGEQIFASQALTGGGAGDSLQFSVPCGAEPQSTSYARFRVSTAGGLASGGPAMNGEVEDYQVTVKGLDLADAPDSYATLVATNGARHVVDPAATTYLGACVDTEANGQPAAAFGDAADGDDADDLGTPTGTVGTCAGNDDEDGVSFTTMIAACATDAEVSVISAGTGSLDAWIDFNGDGDFADAGEQIFTSEALTGSDTLQYSVPCEATTGDTYARFRVSTAGGLASDGLAMDGEVEDYLVTTKSLDLGDAPDSYATLVASDGARHALDPSSVTYLGACVDGESDGQPAAAFGDAADGDDANDLGAPIDTLGTCNADDDEDGVTFDTPILACATDAEITVTSFGTGLLDAWIDFNADGDFADAGEQIFASQALTGSDTLQYSVPCSAGVGDSYARFRISTAGGLAFDGMAMDGEIEDYEVSMSGRDLADAPDSYGTTDGASGPSHTVSPAASLYLGACVDTEADGQPAAAFGDPADGDDANDLGTATGSVGICAGNDDEDGIAFTTAVAACDGAAGVDVTASASGLLDAWIDFDGDGSFAAAEQIFSSEPLAAGTNSLTYAVPCDAAPGDSYARFRLSTAGGLGATGPADDGEVEDYLILQFASDFGDAPDSYTTTFSSGGPTHGVNPGSPRYLGACVDTEVDGQPAAAFGDPADGDDADDLGAPTGTVGTCTVGDEDGVAFTTTIVACDGAAGVDVTAVGTGGILDAWIDFNADGDFADAGEQIFAGQVLSGGGATDSLTYPVPCSTVSSDTYARFRLSSAGVASFGGPAPDGEIEDYSVTVSGLDFGDSPDPAYPVLLASDGARHAVLPVGNPTLGSAVDTEPEGLQSTTHLGDDQDGSPDDEDGISFMSPLVPGATTDVMVNTGDTGGLLSAWIDFNADGDWDDPGEQIATDLAIGANTMTSIAVAVPVAAVMGDSCARFRFSSDTGLLPTGLATDGEVEDYAVAIGMEDPFLGIAKQLLSIEDIGNGDWALSFEMVVLNMGNVDLSGVQVDAAVALAFDGVSSLVIDSVTSPTLSINPAYDGDTVIGLLIGTDTLAIGEMATIQLDLVINPGGMTGPFLCTSVASGTSPGGMLVTDDSQDGGDPDPNGNGDPTDNGEPTPVVFPLEILEIPTLTEWSLLFFALLLALFAMRILHANRRARG